MRNADELQESFASPLEFKQTCTIIISAYRHTIATLPPFNKIQIQKKPPEGGFTTLLIALILFLSFPWYPERDLNPHSANAEGF